MDSFIQFLAIVLPLIFTSNMLLTVVKYLADQAISRYGLRVLLAIIAILGTLAMNALMGTEPNVDSISSLFGIIIEAVSVGFGAHYTYRAIKEAPSPVA